MVARATQDSIDLGWSDPPLSDTIQDPEQPAVPLDNLDDDEPTRVATSAAAIVVPAATVATDVASAPPADAAIEMAPTLPAGSAALEALAVVADAIDASDIHDEGARVTEPGLAPPPPTSSQIAAAEAVVAEREIPVAAVPETAVAPVSEAPVAPVHEMPLPAAQPGLVESRVEASHPATIPSPSAAMPAVSIPPPPIAPSFFTPSSFAPTAADWNELASPSLLATMKRTRPTSAWTGVGLFVGALTFAGGIGIGRSMNPPTLPPVAVPAPLQASVAAGSLSPTSALAHTAEQPAAPAAPAAPSKPPAPFDAKAARAALDDAANAAKTCRAAGDPKGTVPTTVTFGPSGIVSSVAINSSRYAGTKTARCIAERLNQARVSEFSGFPEALKKLVTVH